mmetsp:Transcript_1436/g.3067  ORF Transcript_1436/g.3067 Transcript_1436/m.3067 type:complete len:244 (-) Transcript_1436:478-1209(-)
MERPLDGEVVSTGQKRHLIHRGSPQAKAEMSDSPCVSQQAAADTGQFDCNICLDMAYEPVVTACGHLYCWPCVYKWLQQHETDRLCPVCKAAVTGDSVIPIYGRGRPPVDPRSRESISVENVPDRPPAQRPVVSEASSMRREVVGRRIHETVDRSTTAPFNFWVPARGGLIPEAAPGQPGASTTLTAGLSFLPTFFGLHLSHPQGVQGEPGAEALSPEQAQQALLSRLLLLLGSMVILCLLLF